MLGNYNPDDFMPSVVMAQPDEIIQVIREGISTDSLHNYLLQLSSYENRNTGSDTVSATYGIGAARRWVYERFQQMSAESENRLIPFYLQFDQEICGMDQHRNICAVLPGTDLSKPGMVLP